MPTKEEQRLSNRIREFYNGVSAVRDALAATDEKLPRRAWHAMDELLRIAAASYDDVIAADQGELNA